MRVAEMKRSAFFTVLCSALTVIINKNRKIDFRNCLNYHHTNSLNVEIMDFEKESVS